ncbi:MAG: hypothetical protein Kow00120_23370 [Anaerolineae bacterium]
MPDAILVCDGQGRVVFLNRAAERITGLLSVEASGRMVGSVLRLSESDDARLISHILSPDFPFHIEVAIGDTARTTAATTGFRWTPPRSDVAHVVLLVREATSEETYHRLYADFLASVSHEFRTPLSSLSASIELLLDEVGRLSPAEIHELLQSVHLSVSGLQALVDNLLQSASIETGRFTIHRRPIDLNRVTADAIRTMQPLLDRRRQPLALVEPLQLPPVNADPSRLIQVLINLLSNASKYSPLDAIIDLSIQHAGDALKVAVADRGPGIPPAEREALFHRFVHLRRDAAQHGVGLGLSVVKAIIAGHGGEVGVDDRPGGGAVFWFTLPLTRDAV